MSTAETATRPRGPWDISSEVRGRLFRYLFQRVGIEQVRAEFAALGDNPSETALDLAGATLATGFMTEPMPLRVAPAEEWLGYFRRTGYVADCLRLPARRPKKSLLLYRGARLGAERGLSWTPVRARAEEFVYARREQGLDAALWSVRARPEWMLARLAHERGVEIVLDVPDVVTIRRLKIRGDAS